MAESKNNFIRARMNQDLDDRLVARGEYRVGQNLTISRSEGDDVGTFQNVLGNTERVNIFEPLQDGTRVIGSIDETTLLIIGYFVDEPTDRAYIFATNYNDSSSDQLSNAAPDEATCAILRYDFSTNTIIKLVAGSFLNFSKTHYMLGINLIENLLFFTDNRNQPRKINVSRATSGASNEVVGALSGSLTSSITTNATGITNATYIATVGSTPGVTSSLSGSDTEISITVSTNTVTAVNVTYGGKNFVSGETITITSALLTGANQSVVITITTSNLQSVDYYSNEDQVSVVKFYPYNPPVFYKELTFIAKNTSQPGVQPYYDQVIQLDTDLDKSQLEAAGLKIGLPVSVRKTDGSGTVTGLIGRDINIQAINNEPATSSVTISLSSPATWTSGDKIVVSMYGLKSCSNPYLPVIFNTELSSVTGSPTNGQYLMNDANGNNPLLEGIGTTATSELWITTDTGDNNAEITIEDGFKIIGQSNKVITINNGKGEVPTDLDGSTINIFRSNPDYKSNFAGDSEFLKDKFVRFSYRYKFDDNEYSLMAPFSQIAFVPKQFGNFIGADEAAAGKSSVVEFMENNIDCVELFISTPFKTDTSNGVIPCGTSWLDTMSNLHIKQIEILCSFSNETSIKVVEVLDVQEITNLSLVGQQASGGSVKYDNVFKYTYESTKPIRVLPEEDTTRVFDKAPLRAKSQEVAGNRVMYGNFIDKHSSPLNLDYKLGVVQKVDIPLSQDKRALFSHNLKENRTYQVGLVLQDRYGRSTDVVLSKRQVQAQSVFSTDLGASTIYNPYSTSNDFSATDILNFTGKQLLISLESAIPTAINGLEGYPGLYSESNQLGFYSYKVVVQQKEQEYYNVYMPNTVRIDQAAGTNSLSTSYFSLINDNINKVPKDLSNVGPEEKEFRSSVELFPRVNPKFSTTSYPQQDNYFITPLRKNDVVNSIIYNTPGLTQADLAATVATPPVPIIGLELPPDVLYKGTTATAAQVFNNKRFGTLKSTLYSLDFNVLGVYETSGFESNLDIYYETSTSGLVEDLNTSINTSTGGPVELTQDTFSLFENSILYDIGTGSANQPQFGQVIFTIEVKNQFGIPILDAASTCTITSITSSLASGISVAGGRGRSNNVSLNRFEVVPQQQGTPLVNTGRFDLYNKTENIYASTGVTLTFTINVTTPLGSKTFVLNGDVNNIQPQVNQAENPGSSFISDSLTPARFEPYKNYSQMTAASTGVAAKSLKPHYYTTPNNGDNKAAQGVGEYGTLPYIYIFGKQETDFTSGDPWESGPDFPNAGYNPEDASRLGTSTINQGQSLPYTTNYRGTFLAPNIDPQFQGGVSFGNALGIINFLINYNATAAGFSQFDNQPSQRSPIYTGVNAPQGWCDAGLNKIYGGLDPNTGLTLPEPYNPNNIYLWQMVKNTFTFPSPGVTNPSKTYYCSYVEKGGLNDAFKVNVNGIEQLGNTKYSAQYWWRKMMYNYTSPTTTPPVNYPYPDIPGTVIPSTSPLAAANTITLQTGMPSALRPGFQNLVKYESNTDVGIAYGPWNIFNCNETDATSKNFATALGFDSSRAFKFSNGTGSVTDLRRDITYQIKDLHFPTGDILADPNNPTGRFGDTTADYGQGGGQAFSDGEIARRLAECVGFNVASTNPNAGINFEINEQLLMQYFGAFSTYGVLIPDAQGNTFGGGIILNNRLGHGGLIVAFKDNIGWDPIGYFPGNNVGVGDNFRSLGSYGMFWIGFTVEATDSWGTTTSKNINLIVIA